MKLVMDERLKHRLVGLAVIISIGAIFAPAVMKKSNQRFEEKSMVSLKLPPKPSMPNVAISNEKTLFSTVKVAHVEIPSLDKKNQPVIKIAKAESLSQMNDARIMTEVAKKEAIVPVAEKALQVGQSRLSAPQENKKKIELAKAINKAKTKTLKPVVAKTDNKLKPKTVTATAYAVQLATFSLQSNATSLVSKLKNKGYKASVSKSTTKKGVVYKVLVGNTNQKHQAQVLQQQLASLLQISGYVVPTTGIS